MKQYTKNNKIYNTPVKIFSKGKVIITNDPKVLAKHGYIEYVAPVIEKTKEQLIIESNNRLNRECDEKILNGFVYKGEEFYLTIENQTNFANMYIAKEFLTYPQTIKTKKGFLALASQEDVTDFYLAGINFVKACLEECWAAKAKAEEEINSK